MGWMNTGIAKTRAMASDARADLAETDSDLIPAKAWLTITSTVDAALSTFGGTWAGRQKGVSTVVEAATAQTHALRSRAQATVDELTAKQEAARSRLSFAEKSQNLAEKSQHAMTKLAEETDRIIND